MSTTVQTANRYLADGGTRSTSPMSRIVGGLRGALFFEVLAIVLNPLIAAKATGLSFQVGTDGHSAVAYLSNPSNTGIAVALL